jgi:hypothetical protein
MSLTAVNPVDIAPAFPAAIPLNNLAAVAAYAMQRSQHPAEQSFS